MKTKFKKKKLIIVFIIFFSFFLLSNLGLSINLKNNYFYFSFIQQISSLYSNINVEEIELKEKKKFFHNGSGELIAIQGIDGTSNDDDYNIFVANGYRNSIGFINKEKLLAKKIKNLNDKNQVELFADVYFKNNQEIYWASYRNNAIYKSDHNLKISKKKFAEGFLNPIGIDGTKNKIIIADQNNHEIVCLDQNGKEIWRKKYYINFKLQKNPYGISILNNHAYITFSLHENLNVVKIDLDGNIKNIIFNSKINGKNFSNIQSIDLDTYGNIFFHDTGNQRVLLYNSNMKIIKVLKSKKIKIGRGLAILKPKNLIVISGFAHGRKLSSEFSGFWIFENLN